MDDQKIPNSPTLAPPVSPVQALSVQARFVLGLGILFGFATLGSALVSWGRWLLPGSVVGMVLLWASLSAGLIRLEWISEATDGFLGICGGLGGF